MRQHKCIPKIQNPRKNARNSVRKSEEHKWQRDKTQIIASFKRLGCGSLVYILMLILSLSLIIYLTK